MELEPRKRFIIDTVYLLLLLLIAYGVIRWILPMLTPFLLAFLIAAVLQRPIRFVSRHAGGRKGLCAVLTVLVFYSTIGVLFTLLCLRLFSSFGDLIAYLPTFYSGQVEPVLFAFAQWAEGIFGRLDPATSQAINDTANQVIQSLGSSITQLSLGAISGLSSYATTLPGFLVKMMLMMISTFFIAQDYDRIVAFLLRQFSERASGLLLHIKSYVVGTLFLCVRSYALIMSLTFIELAIGLSVLRVENAIAIALCISIFDVLPVLGTGGVMIPWMLISLLQGNYSLGIGLAVVYVAITVIRNILEPKIVGAQLGLHPVLTLVGMFVGAQLFGILGLFGAPITLSLIIDLNKSGYIKLFR